MAQYPAIKTKRLTCEECVFDTDGKKITDVSQFWSWAYSDLVGNTERGALAEFLVACAIGVQNKERVSWDRYDLLSPEGIAIEVKSSGYIQTWEQEKLSDISFGIQPTYGWDSNTNQYDTIRHRQSDVYVFCVHKHTEQESINPLDISQWDFYILATSILNEKVGIQKRISLSSLVKKGALKCEYKDLHKKIIEIASNL